jgi:hypothetical protein
MKNKKYHTVKIVHITSIGKSCKDRPTQINCTVHTHDLVHALQSKVEGLRQFWRYQGAVRSRKWKKDRQYNVQKKRQRTNNELQNMPRTLLKQVLNSGVPERIPSSCSNSCTHRFTDKRHEHHLICKFITNSQV